MSDPRHAFTPAAGPPEPAPASPPLPQPRDIDHPGVLRLFVDATDVERRIFRCRQIIPAAPGPLTLLYPKWLPGYHSAAGAIELLTGLTIRANGRTIEWKRDPVEVYAFHLDVPEGGTEIEAEFQFVSPTCASQGPVIVTTRMLLLRWSNYLLYPAGYYARRIQFEPSLRLPAGWRYATALETRSVESEEARFHPLPLDQLIDSPVLAGQAFARIELDGQAIALDLVADDEAALKATAEQIEGHRGVIRQADLLFGSRPFDHYDYLTALTKGLGEAGVEHHRSCEIVTAPDYFTTWDQRWPRRETFGHEYVHAWNGKRRRGADSWTPAFEQPIRNSLMWVYEGLTQYWGNVLVARAGLWTLDQAREAVAYTASRHALSAGRRWRAMCDTTRDPIISERSPVPWPSWQRSEDYYTAGMLLWLEIDTLIAKLTGEAKSLDDFARSFFGGTDGDYGTTTFVMDDVVAELQAVAPYDWQGFIDKRLNEIDSSEEPVQLAHCGYKLAYGAVPNAYAEANEEETGTADLLASIGVNISTDGNLTEVLWEGPAFQARLTSGMQVVGVNGRPFDLEQLKAAIAKTADGEGLSLRVSSDAGEREVTVDYDCGARHPHLEPTGGEPLRLDAILRSRG